MTTATRSECPVCAASVDVPSDAMLGELLDCGACGSELEVTSLGSSVELAEAPMAGEDWGE